MRHRSRSAPAYEAWLAGHDAVDPGARGASDDTVVQMYTSGTTGVPKGVLTTHRNLAAAAETSPRGLRCRQREPHRAADVPHRWDRLGVRRALERGDHHPRQRFRPGCGARPSRAPRRYQRGVRADDAADAVRGPGARGSRLLGPALDRVRRLADHDSRAQAGAAHVRLRAVRDLRPDRNDRRAVQLDAGDHDPDGPREHLLRSAGRPTRGWSFGSWTPPTGATAPPGEVGEVWLRAPNVMAGYFNRPDETAAALTPDGWLRTGDGGYRRRRGLPVPDRPDQGHDRLRRRERLSGRGRGGAAQHPDVIEVAVIGVPDERWGETVKALIVRRPGRRASGGARRVPA